MDKNEIKEVLQEVESERRMNGYPEEGSDIDWQELFAKAWNGKKLIIAVTCIFMALGLFSALTMKRTYCSTVTLVPELGKSSSNSLSSLASSLGLANMQLNTADAYNVAVYPEVVSSTPFATRLFDIHVSDPENEIDTTLAGYMTRKQFSLVGAVVKPIMSLFASEKKKGKALNDIDLFHLTKKQDMLVKALNKSIVVDVDKKTGETTIDVTMDNAIVAATVADSVCKYLREYITEYRTQKARENLESYQKIANESYQKYLKASRAYAYYQDHNRGLILNSMISEGTRLSNEVQIASQLYSQMKIQAEMARGKVIEESPVFAIVQPASVPLKASNSRAKVLIIWTFMGFLLSAAWVLYGKEYWGKGKAMLKDVKSKAQ